LALAVLATSTTVSAAACPAPDPAAVSGAVPGMFSAMATGDLKAAHSYVVPDCYIYDGGMRFDADGIVGLIRQLQQAGAV